MGGGKQFWFSGTAIDSPADGGKSLRKAILLRIAKLLLRIEVIYLKSQNEMNLTNQNVLPGDIIAYFGLYTSNDRYLRNDII